MMKKPSHLNMDFWYYNNIFVTIIFLLPLRSGLLLVLGLYKEDYLHNLKCVSFLLNTFCC